MNDIDDPVNRAWIPIGSDGFENPFGHDFVGMRHRFASGLAEAMDAVPGVRIAVSAATTAPAG